ncbi:DUF4158 domain-containing protein [Mycobacterium haemophilum]
MHREWASEDLIASWTLVGGDWELVANKTGATRLGFSLLLKFFELEARFPHDVSEVPGSAVDYVAEQVKVDSAEFARYDWNGRAIERYWMQIRGAFGFRMFTRADEDKRMRSAACGCHQSCSWTLRRSSSRPGVPTRARSYPVGIWGWGTSARKVTLKPTDGNWLCSR